MKRKIKNLILKGLACIAGFNLIVFVSSIDSLTRYGLVQGLIVNGIGTVYLFILLYANGWLTGTNPYHKKGGFIHELF